jgi:hypothetical protein
MLGLFLFLGLSFLKHFLNGLLKLVPRQERDDVLGQRMPLILLLGQEVEYEAVAAVSEDVEATVGKIRTDVKRVASKKTKVKMVK